MRTEVLAGFILADIIAEERKSYYLLRNQDLGVDEMAESFKRVVEETMNE